MRFTANGIKSAQRALLIQRELALSPSVARIVSPRKATSSRNRFQTGGVLRGLKQKEVSTCKPASERLEGIKNLLRYATDASASAI